MSAGDRRPALTMAGEKEEVRETEKVARLVKAATEKSGKTVEELLAYYEESSPEYAAELRRLIKEEGPRRSTAEPADSSKTQG